MKLLLNIVFKTITFCLLAIFLLPPIIAQQGSTARQTDSILAILPQLHDDEKLNAIATLVVLNDHNWRLTKRYADMLLVEARRQKNIEEEAYALAKIADYYANVYHTDSIFIAGEEAVQFARAHKFYDLLFSTLHNIIMRHQIAGRTLTALRMAEEAYVQSLETQDEWQMARMLNTIAALYFLMEQKEEALRFYEKSIEMAQKNRKNDWLYVRTYDIMAHIAHRLHRHEQTLIYNDGLKAELELYKKNNPEINVQYHSFAFERNRAQAYAGLKQMEEALQAVEQAKTLFDPQWAGTYSETELDYMLYVYYNAAGNLEKAMVHLNSMLHNLENYNDELSTTLQMTWLKARLMYAMGDYRHAAQTAFYLVEHRDTLNTQRFYAQINELRTIFQLDQAELETERRQAKIRQQRILILASLAVSLMMAIVVALVVRNRRKIEQKNIGLYRQMKEHERQREEYESKIEALIEPPTDKSLEEAQNGDRQQRELVKQLQLKLSNNRYFAKNDIKAGELATELLTYRTYLYEAVKAVTGKSLQEYINDIKIMEAKKLLETTDEPIKSIYETCGFSSQRTFYRQFTDNCKMTPAEYRNSSNKVV